MKSSFCVTYGENVACTRIWGGKQSKCLVFIQPKMHNKNGIINYQKHGKHINIYKYKLVNKLIPT